MSSVPFDTSELRRYGRQMLLPELGEAGQRRLRQGRVLLVGTGGLGSPAAMYLAAAGVGTLGLVDFDTVDESNLQRQLLFSTVDVGRSKLAAASERLRAMNPGVALELHEARFDLENAAALVAAFDIVIDGTDNFPTRYLVNDACVLGGKPNVYGSVSRFEGQAAVFGLRGGPCYRCLHPEPPPPGLIPNCAEAGVLGVLPGLVGTIQAAETIKLLAGIGEPLAGRLLLIDAMRMSFRAITLPRDPACPVCGDRPSIRTLARYDAVCEPAEAGGSMTADELDAWRREGRRHALVDVREPFEHAASHIDGAMLIPLGSIMANVEIIPADRPVVVHCKSGGRSARPVAMLRARGIDARNLAGGIDAWLARQVGPRPAKKETAP